MFKQGVSFDSRQRIIIKKFPKFNTDAGIYECQVSTEPKVSARVHLHVVGKLQNFIVLKNFLILISDIFSLVPRTEVIGDPERYVKSGSSVVLRCVVRGALEPPSYIIWYHDAHQLLSENQQKWEIKLSKGTPDSDGDIPNIVSIFFLYNCAAIFLLLKCSPFFA